MSGTNLRSKSLARSVEMMRILLTQGHVIPCEVNKCQSRFFIFSAKTLNKDTQYHVCDAFDYREKVSQRSEFSVIKCGITLQLPLGGNEFNK